MKSKKAKEFLSYLFRLKIISEQKEIEQSKIKDFPNENAHKVHEERLSNMSKITQILDEIIDKYLEILLNN